MALTHARTNSERDEDRPRRRSYQEMAEEYGLAVDMAPQECWDAHRERFFAMLPLAAIPEVGTPIGDVEGPPLFPRLDGRTVLDFGNLALSAEDARSTVINGSSR